MKSYVLYGKSKHEFDVPSASVYHKKKMPVSSDPVAAVRQALSSPENSPSLCDIALGKRSACIVVNDITRPVPNRLLLPLLCDELEAGGIHRSDITILIATGTHRPNEGDELVELIGPESAASLRVVNHDCHADDTLRLIGNTASGTPVWLNRHYLDADVKILTGLIEPHFMAGYSGGRKAICPGIAGIQTVRHIHSPRFMEHSLACNCNLDTNPLHSELLEISSMSGVDFILNVVIDEARNICGVFAGHVDAAHRAGVAFSCQHDRVPAQGYADIVITSSAGYPLDKTYYQTIKGMVGALTLVKPGGAIIIASECSEGMGNPTFVDSLRVLHDIGDIETYVKHISVDSNFIPDQWQVEKLSQALRRATVYFYSGSLTHDYDDILGVHRVESIAAGLKSALASAGSTPNIAVVPEGPYVIPFVEDAC